MTVSFIEKMRSEDRMYLSYDQLVPEEAHKILDVIMADDMCETMQWFETKLNYDVTGFRGDVEGQTKWSHDLVLTIASPMILGSNVLSIEAQLAQDKEDLKAVQQIIYDRTGIM